MNYISARVRDVANGPGIRASIWLSGCSRRCEDCFNPEAWSFDAGKELTPQAIKKFASFGYSEGIAGFSILGGEPLQQYVMEMLSFMEELRKVGKPIWMWTGYTFEELSYDQKEIVKLVDVLVDGPFEKDKFDPNLKFRGSSNQRIIDVQATLRYNSIKTLDY